jgi:hypothetical protein
LASATTGTGLQYIPNNAVIVAANGGNSCLIANKTDSTTGSTAIFRYNGSTVGDISITSTNAAYNTASSSTNGAQLNYQGITFPATQSASSDANTLDDYEEGTWTPSIAGTTTAGTASYSVREANYTKIGNLVYFSLFIDYSSGTGTGNTKITGLPFSSSSSNLYVNACATNVRSLTYTGSQIVAYTEKSSSAIVVAQASTANFGEFALPYDSGASFAISGFYQV